MNAHTSENFEYSDSIRNLRASGDLDAAVSLCQTAIGRYPEENFYPKILGDILLQKKDYDGAFRSYCEFLHKIGDKKELFNNFSKFYQRLKNKGLDLEPYNQELLRLISERMLPDSVVNLLFALVQADIPPDRHASEILELCDNDKNFSQVSSHIKQLQQQNRTAELMFFLNAEAARPISSQNKRISLYLISVMEKRSMLPQALKLSEQILQSSDDSVAIRTLFRICRKLSNYQAADHYLETNPEIVKKTEFNIQYELVYYFDSKNLSDERNRALAAIKKNARDSVPIARTLYNFYMRFDMLEEAKQILIHIGELVEQKAKGGWEAENESDQAVWLTIKELKDEQEHTRQMSAIRELVMGFSHELGQPVTNIRYGIQLYRRKQLKGVEAGDVNQLLTNILEQTNRLGKLLERFSPIVSSRSTVKDFEVGVQIRNVFEELSSRLAVGGVIYEITVDSPIRLHGDPVQFDQVFYNLVLNSIHAIRKKAPSQGLIRVRIADSKNASIITFTDNGTGVPKELQQKIFEPFYSTKREEGGEGLGLFIVWNILKMFEGTISLDRNYRNGTRFVMKFKHPKEA